MKAASISIRHLSTVEEFERCVELQRAVWQESIIVPSALFVVALESGGQVIGAFAGREMIGFLMALVGAHEGRVFLHSHMTAVLPGFQNQGAGRLLKLAQRDDALRRGIRRIEWTFDPLESRNAFFNLRRLGAIARRYLPNCYGITDSPLHAGLPTDRLVAEWILDSPRVAEILAGNAPEAPHGAIRICLPSGIAEMRQKDRAAALREQERLRREFQQWFAEGYAAMGFEQLREGELCYVLAPHPESQQPLD